MRREFHVRFCEGGGVRFPSATRLLVIFEREDDARRVLDVLPKRLAKYGLQIHPEKTRLIDFRRPDRRPAPSGVGIHRDRPETFDLLGFTHYWAMSRKGHWVVKQKTAADRIRRAIKHTTRWCRSNRHQPVHEQWQALKRKLLGHFAYYGVIGNLRSLRAYRHRVRRAWWKWLSRRSQKSRVSWERMGRLLERYPLPEPRIRPRLAVT